MNADTRAKVFCAILLGLILLVAGALRLDGLTSESAWVDEFIAIKHAAGHPLNAPQPDRPDEVLLFSAPSPASLIGASPWYAAWSSVRDDIHPPFYFVALRLWLNVFGDSDAAARMLSVVCSLLAIALLYDVCRLLHGRSTALFACALMALSLTQIRYAQEARNYAMTTALLLLACSAAVRIERIGGNRLRYIALFTAALLLPLTHYLSIVPLLAVAIYLIVRLRCQRNLTAIRGVIATSLTAGILFLLIGGPMLWHQRQNSDQVNLRFDRESGRIQRTLERIATIPLRYIGESLDPNPLTTAQQTGHFARAAWPILPMIVVYVVPLIVLRRRPDLSLWELLLVAGIAPVVAGDLVRQTGNLQLIRYALLGAPAAFVLTAASLSHLRNPILARALPVLMAIFAVCVLPMKFQSIKPDYRQLVDQIRASASADDAIVIAGSDPGPWYLMTMYQGVMRYMYPAPCPVAVITRAADEPLLAQLRARRTLWVVWGSQRIDPSSVLPGAQHQVVGEYRNLAYLLRVQLSNDGAATTRAPKSATDH